MREQYFRNDLWCGSSLCEKCEQETPTLASGVPHYVVLDTNVVLHQIDLLENPTLKNVIIPKTVMEEVHHQSLQISDRIKAVVADPARHFFVFQNENKRETCVERLPGESPNDRNDRGNNLLIYRNFLD